MDFFWHLLTVSCIALPGALGFNLVFGKGKFFYFGHVGLSMVSAYASALTLLATQSFLLAFLAALLAAVLCALLLWFTALRLPPDSFGVLSIAAHLMVIALVLNWEDVTRGALGLPGIPRPEMLASVPAFAMCCAGVALFFVLAFFLLDHSPLGRSLQALAEQEWHAESLGISRSRAALIAFLCMAVATSVTAFLWPQYLHLLHPSDYTFTWFVFLATVIIVGKPGNVLGVSVALFALTFIREGMRLLPIAADVRGPLLYILFGVILAVALALRRSTIFPRRREI